MNEQNAPAEMSITTTVTRPTKKQRQLLEYIDAFITEHGYSPSYREIMQGLEYTSVATVALHVGNLIKRGHIRKRDNAARSLEIVAPLLPTETTIKTNQVSESEEKWLLQRVDYVFAQAESEAIAIPETIVQLQTLVDSLHILGLEAGAQQFRQRLMSLPKTDAATKRLR